MNDDSPGADGRGELEIATENTARQQVRPVLLRWTGTSGDRQALIREITLRPAFELAHGQDDTGQATS